MTQQQASSFNPKDHLIQIKSGQASNDYLPVQWRLVWFRQECPNGTIETEIVYYDLDKDMTVEIFVWNSEKRRSEKVLKTAKGVAIFKAIVSDGKGGMAIGTKMENAASFADFLEKAETGAIGRALAALGYGTQFTGDELQEGMRLADAPVPQQAQNTPSQQAKQTQPNTATQEEKLQKALVDLKKRAVEQNVDWKKMVEDLKFSEIKDFKQINEMNSYLKKFGA